LTQPGLSTIVYGIIIARCVFMRIRNFITYRISATLQLLFFFFIAVFSFKPSSYTLPDANTVWPDFFHMPVLLLMLITLLNDGTLIAIGYDTVTPPKTPMNWNLKAIFLVGSVLGGVACISSLIILHWSLDSWNPHGVYQSIGIGGISYGQVTTTIYLKVSVSDFLTLFSARTGGDWFWSARPANLLLGAAAVAISSSIGISLGLPPWQPDGIDTLGLARNPPYYLFIVVLIYCVVWWFIQDAAKVLTYHYMVKYNLFGINETGMALDKKKADALKGMDEESKTGLSKPLLGGGHH
jgi:H+-transporting ATPase